MDYHHYTRKCDGMCDSCDCPESVRLPKLARQMGDEARKAMFLDPCKLTPALDAAVARYLDAVKQVTPNCSVRRP